MQIMLPRVLVIEMLQKAVEKKDDASGKYVDTGEKKDLLIVYPFGQDIKYKPAGCINVEIDPIRVNEVRAFFGHEAMIEVDQETTKNGASFYRFINIYQMPAKAEKKAA